MAFYSGYTNQPPPGRAQYGRGAPATAVAAAMAPLPPISAHDQPQSQPQLTQAPPPQQQLQPQQQFVDPHARVAHLEKSTKELLHQALRIQTDLDESLRLGLDAYRGEKELRTLLRDHVRSSTYVVKTLSHELDMVEERCLSAVALLRQSSQVMERQLQLNAGRAGWTQQQQDCVNTMVRDAVHGLGGEHRLFQSRVLEEIRKLNERLDSLSTSVGQSKGSVDSAVAGLQSGHVSLQEQVQLLTQQLRQQGQEVSDGLASIRQQGRAAQETDRQLGQIENQITRLAHELKSSVVQERAVTTEQLVRLEAACTAAIMDAERRVADRQTQAVGAVSEQIVLVQEQINRLVIELRSEIKDSASKAAAQLDKKFQEAGKDRRVLEASVAEELLKVAQGVEDLEAKLAKVLRTVVVI
eukprot:m.36578 g.36578  ORF g.36578 m.36578 type:complete len:412 (-) comp11437_c0_seq2:350-1585(-)